jgi:hypothetical protein
MNRRQPSRTFFKAVRFLPLVSLWLSCLFLPAAAQPCGAQGVAVQVLGSGGPELQDKRAMSSYLLWENGQARVLIERAEAVPSGLEKAERKCPSWT